MIIERNAEYYEQMIAGCERNIEFVKKSNFCRKEKQDLIASYNQAIGSYKRKLMSFYPEYQE